MKITLGLIVRNEGKTLKKCLESASKIVDEIVVGLAGPSTDDTELIARQFTPKVIPIEWKDDFALARNELLEHVDGDYFFWLDGDDEVINGASIRDFIVAHPEIDRFDMVYDYGRDEQGITVSTLVRERIIRSPHDWKWHGKIHEYLIPKDKDFRPNSTLIPDVVIKHHHGKQRDPNRNLALLYKELEEAEPEPSDRLLVYLGNEEAIKGNFKQAILHWRRYLAKAPRGDEAYQIQHKLADVYRHLGDYTSAMLADFQATTIAPSWPDAYFGVAETCYRTGQFAACVEWTKNGATKEVPTTSLIINPLDYYFYPRITVAGAYAQLGLWEEALGNYELAFKVKPDPQVGKQIALLKEQVNEDRILQQFLQIAEFLGRNDEWLKLRNIFTSVPKVIEQHPAIRSLWARVSQSTAHVYDPQIMSDFYKNNPNWQPIDEKLLDSSEWENFPRLQFAKRNAERIEAQNIVDVGCSDGFISLPLAQMGYHVDGLDIDPRCIDVAKERAEKWGIKNTSFTEGDVSTINEWADCDKFYKYDLAVVFELLEHVADLDTTLNTIERAARHVAITTPFMAWDLGNQPDWDDGKPKPHLRIFDLTDMEILLSQRGRIHSLYREPWANTPTGWIFASYDVDQRPVGSNVSIICPPTLEEWGPRKLKEQGLGGSETAVIRLSEAFAKSDHSVTVYNGIDEPGYYNYVRYRDIKHFVPEIRMDLTIAWRYPELADDNPNTNCLVLWMHDTDLGDRLTETRAREFDAFVVLSQWHKDFFSKKYPFVKKDKIIVVGNGVDVSRFNAESNHRNPHRVAYSSSPDRGLDIILESIWPKVVAQIPDAELHYYYGWNNFDKSGRADLIQFKAKIASLSMDGNVVSHGRLPQDKLAEELQQASVWLYPTYFPETYCITAVEAQLAGLIPITNHYAGLKEVVPTGDIIEGDVHDPEIQEKYVRATVEWLKADVPDHIRQQIREKVPAQSWDDVASLWAHYFIGD